MGFQLPLFLGRTIRKQLLCLALARSTVLGALFVFSAVCFQTALAEPELPALSDDSIETIPAPALGISQSNTSELDAKLRESPRDAEAIYALAGMCLSEAKKKNSPRYLGYAQAILSRLPKETLNDIRFAALKDKLELAQSEYFHAPR